MAKRYLLWSDVVRVVGVAMVLLLHAAAPYVDRFSQVPLPDWNYTNWINAFTRASVPLFFMLSGMLLLPNTEQPPLSFYRKRFKRVLPPLLFWSVIYLVWANYHTHAGYTLSTGLKAIVLGDVRFHLWFIYVLMALYLGTPLLRLLIVKLHRRWFVGAVVVWFLFISVFPMLTKFTPLEITWQTDSLLLHYLGYYLLGYLLADTVLSSRQSRLFWAAFWLASVGATAYFTFQMSVKKDGLTLIFERYTSVNVVIMSAALFLLLKSLPYERWFDNLPRVKTSFQEISRISYGMYIGHVLFQEMLWENWPDRIGWHPLLVIPLIVVSVGLITAGVLLAASRVPVLRRLVN